VGNREALTTMAGVVTYTYDVANRLTGMGGETFTWDDRGNLTHDGTFTYTYDAAGPLVGAQSITNTLVYTYNGDGVRVAQSVEGSRVLAILGARVYNDATGRKECEMDDMSTVDWEIEQLVKARLFPDQQAVIRSALRALFQAQPGIRRQMIVSAYVAGDISLGKAAELMGVSHEEMKDILAESGAEVHLGPRTAEELLQDAANA
jgi:predicted HTH domain antitoxin